jgi:hypothetical protein
MDMRNCVGNVRKPAAFWPESFNHGDHFIYYGGLAFSLDP